MSKLTLIKGDLNVSEKEKALNELRDEVSSKSWVTFKERIVFAYHFLSLGGKKEAEKLLNSIDKTYWTTGIFMDLYRSVMAELMFKVEKHAFEREFEYFIIAKRMTVMMKELNLAHNWEIYKFSENFKKLSDFTSPPQE